MHNPMFRQKTSHIHHGAQVCAYSTVVILDIRITKYLPEGIRSWQPALNRIIRNMNMEQFAAEQNNFIVINYFAANS